MFTSFSSTSTNQTVSMNFPNNERISKGQYPLEEIVLFEIYLNPDEKIACNFMAQSEEQTFRPEEEEVLLLPFFPF